MSFVEMGMAMAVTKASGSHFSPTQCMVLNAMLLTSASPSIISFSNKGRTIVCTSDFVFKIEQISGKSSAI
jgi:hypothetical protein